MQRRYRKRPPKRPEVKKYRVNEEITAPELFVIDEEGNKLGVMPRDEALKKAEEAELDLVEVFPAGNPPVAKILNYGQFKYEQEKKLKKQKASQKKIDTKGVKLSFRIKGKDLEMRRNQALKFLEEGHNVKIELRMQGREKAHTDRAVEMVENFLKSLGNVNIINPINKQGGRITVEVNLKK